MTLQSASSRKISRDRFHFLSLFHIVVRQNRVASTSKSKDPEEPMWKLTDQLVANHPNNLKKISKAREEVEAISTKLKMWRQGLQHSIIINSSKNMCFNSKWYISNSNNSSNKLYIRILSRFHQMQRQAIHLTDRWATCTGLNLSIWTITYTQLMRPKKRVRVRSCHKLLLIITALRSRIPTATIWSLINSTSKNILMSIEIP